MPSYPKLWRLKLSNIFKTSYEALAPEGMGYIFLVEMWCASRLGRRVLASSLLVQGGRPWLLGTWPDFYWVWTVCGVSWWRSNMVQCLMVWWFELSGAARLFGERSFLGPLRCFIRWDGYWGWSISQFVLDPWIADLPLNQWLTITETWGFHPSCGVAR